MMNLIENMYREANVLYEKDESFREEANKATLALQNGDKKQVEKLKFIRAMSIATSLKEYLRLGVEMPLEAIRGESFYAGIPPVTEKEIICALFTIDHFERK